MSPKPPPRKIARCESPAQAVPLPSSLDNMFLNLPLDLLVEIATYIRPLDLVRIARVNKTIRALLMHRSAVCIWRTALRAANALPPSPTDISEPLLTALLFLAECTVCGRYTDENIDFALRLKLCSECLKTDILLIPEVEFAKFLYMSNSRGPSLKLCLRVDYERIKYQHESLQASGDIQALKCWTKERLKTVDDRSKSARLLSKWFKTWSKKRRVKQHLSLKERKRLRSARVADIETRMTDMGYQLSEIRQLRVLEPKKWRKWVAGSEPLDDQTWELLLPHLLYHLELCRKRLRRSERQPTLDNTFFHVQNRLKPIRCIQPQFDIEEWALISIPDTDNQSSEPNNNYASPLDNNIILPSFPHSSDILFICAEVEAIVDAPTSRETFELEIRTTGGYIECATQAWRHVMELTLLNLLPEDTLPVEVGTSEYKLVLGAGLDARSLDLLPMEHKKLLRADSIFCLGNPALTPFSKKLLYYPEAFQGQFKLSEKANLYYHPVAAKIAKALLRALGLPDASYLAINALPRLYLCGRCDNKSITFGLWRELLEHYLDKAFWWSFSAPEDTNSRIFTHSIDSVYPEKPLVKLVDPAVHLSAPIGVSNLGHFLCLLCLRANNPANTYLDGENIQYYFQNVHFINEPIEGVHYVIAPAPGPSLELG